MNLPKLVEDSAIGEEGSNNCAANSRTSEDRKTDEIYKILQYQTEYKKILATIPEYVLEHSHQIKYLKRLKDSQTSVSLL